MEILLKSRRDNIFQAWRTQDLGYYGYVSERLRWNYVPLSAMQRGDLKKSPEDIDRLLEKLNKTIPQEGMINPIIIIDIRHWLWRDFLDKEIVDERTKDRDGTYPMIKSTIPFVVHTGNTRYQYALANNYTHISSIILGEKTLSDVWKYLINELSKSDDKLDLDKEIMKNLLGDII